MSRPNPHLETPDCMNMKDRIAVGAGFHARSCYSQLLPLNWLISDVGHTGTSPLSHNVFPTSDLRLPTSSDVGAVFHARPE